jgi:hypothetical protein
MQAADYELSVYGFFMDEACQKLKLEEMPHQQREQLHYEPSSAEMLVVEKCIDKAIQGDKPIKPILIDFLKASGFKRLAADLSLVRGCSTNLFLSSSLYL